MPVSHATNWNSLPSAPSFVTSLGVALPVSFMKSYQRESGCRNGSIVFCVMAWPINKRDKEREKKITNKSPLSSISHASPIDPGNCFLYAAVAVVFAVFLTVYFFISRTFTLTLRCVTIAPSSDTTSDPMVTTLLTKKRGGNITRCRSHRNLRTFRHSHYTEPVIARYIPSSTRQVAGYATSIDLYRSVCSKYSRSMQTITSTLWWHFRRRQYSVLSGKFAPCWRYCTYIHHRYIDRLIRDGRATLEQLQLGDAFFRAWWCTEDRRGRKSTVFNLLQ